LSNFGWQIDIANLGQEALELATHNAYDLIATPLTVALQTEKPGSPDGSMRNPGSARSDNLGFRIDSSGLKVELRRPSPPAWVVTLVGLPFVSPTYARHHQTGVARKTVRDLAEVAGADIAENDHGTKKPAAAAETGLEVGLEVGTDS